MDLFSELEENTRRNSIGKTQIEYKKATAILTPASGFIGSYDYTLNPYSGCSFGCTYCYAAFFSRDEEKRQSWGYWVQVKENALQLITKFRKKLLRDKTIYMSSVTDPYQPIERELNLTRSILEELANFHQPRLVIQTRSPLVSRDVDLFKRFENIQVNMTVTTDSENVRKVFEPLCPSNTSRLKAIKEVNDAGVNTCITMTPLLPIENVKKFTQILKETGVQKFIVQPFHSEKGRFVAGTREAAMQLIEEMNWTPERYKEVEESLAYYLPGITFGREGFAPPV